MRKSFFIAIPLWSHRVLPSEETRWVWVFRAVVVDEDAIRKMGNGRRRLARVGDEVGRYA